MSLATQSVQELTIDQAELAILRQRLAAEKKAIEAELAGINCRLDKTLPIKEFQKVRSARGNLVKQLLEKEAEIFALNIKCREVNAVLQVREHKVMDRFDVKQLTEIRDRWHDYSMDAKNPQRGREVAWKFSQELGAVLKRFFDNGKEQ